VAPLPDSFLARAVADAREAAEARAASLPLAAVMDAAAGAMPARGLRAHLAGQPIAVIAEVKRRSPAYGPIRDGLDPGELAAAYERGGAAAVSVLTEPTHFGGSPDDLRAAKAATGLPVLRKDFVTSAYQVWEARAWGADAVLLIVAALKPAGLDELLAEAAAAGLDALVEVHDRAEAAAAVAAGAGLIGVNARDLRTLEVDPSRFATIRAGLPPAAVVVAESGIRDRADVEAAAAAGADAVLVGESLVRSPDPALAVAALLGPPGPTTEDSAPVTGARRGQR
jgi:indole-3-glycerol phosphate synthase